ncbi:hypothetical protein EGT71_10290 [Atlantibacter subterranea]|uniref:Uncharacterized protein n=1 Tax=Atlantibacter subterraneus TaxID=255519 RepID=A0A3R9GSW9_9ENTR|nr:hypothetical protein [Atlantibacter subterranea]MDA3133328.1 hypothetical protein [Atlantibacter subterranea]RSB62555.1 hypothetical protein EGK67_09640 [Atlantibacter subterranea]RSE03503.1 hypothetical protein EGT84_16280 [Atlantibacter subterranea]RSE26793.1 hypothetical protein EGT71_10290 [Atlantibacter subterranea]
MLHAVLNGKRYGTGIDSSRELNADEARGAEDVLTSIFFSRLAYLPENIVRDFFTLLMPDKMFTEGINELEFWPSWNLEGSRVEPDVTILCGETLIVVEAKRYDNVALQSDYQLARELAASASSELPFADIILLCVGGLVNVAPIATNLLKQQIIGHLGQYPQSDIKTADDFSFYCQSWKSIYQKLQVALADENGNLRLEHARLLQDIHQAFVWHNIQVVDFISMSSLPTPGIRHHALPAFFKEASRDAKPAPDKCDIRFFEGLSVHNSSRPPLRQAITNFFMENKNG